MNKNITAGLTVLSMTVATAGIVREDLTGDQVVRTRESLEALLIALPDEFKLAKEVVQGDIANTEDLVLTPNEQQNIEDHMKKFMPTVYAPYAKKVAAVMNEVPTVVANGKDAPLNETKEERKIRLERERMKKMAQKSAETLTDEFLDDKNWKLNSNNTLQAKIKRNGRSIEIEGDNDTDVKREAKIGFATTIATGNYNITVTMSAGGPLLLYLTDSVGKTIDMSGGVIPEGRSKAAAKLLSSIPTKISIPSNCRGCLFEGKITAQDNKIIIDDFLVKAVIEEGEFAKN